MKVQVLFLGLHGNCRSQMAEGFARCWAEPKIEVVSAGIDPHPLDQQAVAVMNELGIDIADRPCRSLANMDLNSIDLVVVMTAEAARPCSVLPSAPAVIRWDIPSPLRKGQTGSLEDYRWVRDQISNRIADLFVGGYLGTIISLKRNSESVLDHFHEGIIVHDIHRNIIWFNRAAEKITGYDRHEVIGRDCHEVFPGGFCGGQCSFADETPPNFDKASYSFTFTDKNDHDKHIEMMMVTMRDEQGLFQGVLASFRDVTEVTHLRHKLKTVQSFHGIIGSDSKMQTIYDLIRDLASSDCSVLILGESGTGKELVAGAIHGESRRVGRPFVTVNCGALPEGILESELFGHVRGAFTGAIRDKKGRFELADSGTIFLDEIAEISPNMQVKLLRVLQEGVFERVGGENSIRVNVRLISASNKDLRKLVQTGQFREDLFYRLCVMPINLPPLRDRRNDIPLLVNHFISRFSKDINRPIRSISPEAMSHMLDYDWPGNIRELQNAIQYAFVKCKSQTIDIEHLPPEIVSYRPKHPTAAKPRQKKLDIDQVQEALRKTNGNKSRAAQMLGVGRATLHRFLRAKNPPGEGT